MSSKSRRRANKRAKKKAYWLARAATKTPSRGPRDPFYASLEWKRVRYIALRRANGRCECCGRGPKDGAKLHVDHIRPRRRYPELSLDPDNLQVLCASCNAGKGSWDETDWRYDVGIRTDEFARGELELLAEMRARGLLH